MSGRKLVKPYSQGERAPLLGRTMSWLVLQGSSRCLVRWSLEGRSRCHRSPLAACLYVELGLLFLDLGLGLPHLLSFEFCSCLLRSNLPECSRLLLLHICSFCLNFRLCLLHLRDFFARPLFVHGPRLPSRSRRSNRLLRKVTTKPYSQGERAPLRKISCVF